MEVNTENNKSRKYHWKVKKKTSNGIQTEYHSVCAYCAKEVVYRHGNRPQHCPNCGSANYRKPPTEVELFHLQTKYLESRDKDVLSEMYKVIYSYTKSIVKKILPPEFTYQYSMVDEKAMDAAHLLIESYLNKPSFMIEQSFAGYLQSKVKEVLWNKIAQKEDSIGSLEVISTGDSDDDSHDLSEYMDTHSAFESEPESDEPSYTMNFATSKDVLSDVMGLIDLAYKEAMDTMSVQYAMILLIGIYLKLSTQNQDRISRFYKVFGSDTFGVSDKVMLVIYDYLRDEED